jgi:ribosomal protein S18 acetylase RimI-like enzyme
MLARLFRELAPFEPALVGTYPLGLVVDRSDIDIVCACADLDRFVREVGATLQALGVAPVRVARSGDAVTLRFAWDGLAIEVFGQVRPVLEQRGFRHLIIEGQLLVIGGRALRDRVRALKQRGMKTEPAFAEVLGLTGDPFEALLALETWSPERLRGRVAAALRDGPPPVIDVHRGDRGELLDLFQVADDSPREIAGYLALGTVLVATDGDARVGHVQMIEGGDSWELKSLAVVDAYRGSGLGRRLVEAGVAHARERGAYRVVLSTGSADLGVLGFYQRLGFRMARIDRDVFTPAAGYPAELWVDGIRLLDRVWLDLSW